MLLDGRIALVTGAARGIGAEIAKRFAKAGAGVVVVDILEKPLMETLRWLKSSNYKAHAVKCDVTKYSECEKAIEETIKHFGKLDILVNNAGITKDNLMLKMKEADFDAVINVNLKGTFNFSKAAIRPLIKSGNGVIVNISSVIGLMGNPGQANYAASKAGVIGLTRTLARELARKQVRVNAIAPGFIKTDMTDKMNENAKSAILSQVPLQRMGMPEDIALAALFLASDMASYITGQVLVVDGGLVMY